MNKNLTGVAKNPIILEQDESEEEDSEEEGSEEEEEEEGDSEEGENVEEAAQLDLADMVQASEEEENREIVGTAPHVFSSPITKQDLEPEEGELHEDHSDSDENAGSSQQDLTNGAESAEPPADDAVPTVLTRKQHKKLVKQQRREARMNKVPKKVKKRAKVLAQRAKWGH